MKRMSYKTKKVVKWVLIGSALTLLTLFTLLWLLVTLFLFGGPAKKSSSVKDYQDIFEMNIRSGLLVFPEEIAETATDVSFSYYFRDTWDDPTVSVFLQCTYTQEDYEAEVYRLEHTKKVYGGTERGLIRDEDNKYPYPAYIAIDNHHQQYEYALLTGDRQITYIHTAYFGREKVKFSQEYLPVDYMVFDVTSQDYSPIRSPSYIALVPLSTLSPHHHRNKSQ